MGDVLEYVRKNEARRPFILFQSINFCRRRRHVSALGHIKKPWLLTAAFCCCFSFWPLKYALRDITCQVSRDCAPQWEWIFGLGWGASFSHLWDNFKVVSPFLDKPCYKTWLPRIALCSESPPLESISSYRCLFFVLFLFEVFSASFFSTPWRSPGGKKMKTGRDVWNLAVFPRQATEKHQTLD